MNIHCKYDAIVPVKDLKPNPRNPNDHGEDQIARLAAIIKYQGWRYPINVSNQSGFIVSGHGRLLAALNLGLPSVPVSYQDFDSPEQEYAAVVSDNAIASWAELDLSAINSVLGDLGPDFDLDLFGIKGFELEIADKLAPQCDEDEVPEYVEPRTRLGDIYQLGRHRLMCGDSASIDAVEKLMDGEKADMVFTDPPYNLAENLQIAHALPGKDRSEGSKLLQESEWDTGFDINPVLAVISCVLADKFGIVIFTSQFLAADIWAWMKTFCHWYGFAIYERTNPAPMAAITHQRMLISTDLACYGHSKGHKVLHPPGGYLTNVWRSARVHVSEFQGHPTQKPIGMIESVLGAVDFDLALDLFGGSGSTLIACEKTNRRCFMMELDPKYCDVIVARWEKYTGKKAEMLNGG